MFQTPFQGNLIFQRRIQTFDLNVLTVYISMALVTLIFPFVSKKRLPRRITCTAELSVLKAELVRKKLHVKVTDTRYHLSNKFRALIVLICTIAFSAKLFYIWTPTDIEHR